MSPDKLPLYSTGTRKRIVREHEYIEGAETNQMGSLQFFSGDFEGRVGERMLLVQDEAQLGIFKGDSDCVPPFQGLPFLLSRSAFLPFT